MSRVQQTINRYRTCRALLRYHVDAFVVGDPAGSHLNGAVLKTHRGLTEENQSVWRDLLYAASMLRWRRMTQPQPNAYAPDVLEAIESVRAETAKLRGLVNDESNLDAVDSAVSLIQRSDPPTGTELLASILEVGIESCIVVANSGRAQLGLSQWLNSYDVDVWLLSSLRDSEIGCAQSYVVGPPIFYPPSLVTAPITEGVTFVMPSWFTNRSLPESVFSQHAENAIAPSLKVYKVGDDSRPIEAVATESIEDPYYPKFFTRLSAPPVRPPRPDEVNARKIRMCGKLSLWLDDGERIRTLDLKKTQGSRIDYAAIDDVVPGTYLVLREGQTERFAMYEAAFNALQQDAGVIEKSQSEWKSALRARLETYGARHVIKVLEHRGVRAPNRVRAWVDPLLVCPRYADDLRLLLEWIGLPKQPYFDNALRLRQANYKVSSELRQQLEDAVAQADLRPLEESGFMSLGLKQAGFRAMVVSRVLRVDPQTIIVSRYDVRIPFEEDVNRWLE